MQHGWRHPSVRCHTERECPGRPGYRRVRAWRDRHGIRSPSAFPTGGENRPDAVPSTSHPWGGAANIRRSATLPGGVPVDGKEVVANHWALRGDRRARQQHGLACSGLAWRDETGGPDEHVKKRKCPPSVNAIDEQKIPAEYSAWVSRCSWIGSALAAVGTPETASYTKRLLPHVDQTTIQRHQNCGKIVLF